MQGVASVVVAHEGRRRGYASDLVAESMRVARARGQALSALYPFRHGFYASLGYATAVERRMWTFRPEDVPHYPERAAVRRATEADLAAIDACYARVMRRSTLMVERGPEDWKRRHFEEGKRYAAVYDAGGVRGYFIFHYREHADGRHTELVIPEIVYDDQEALRGLLGHVAALRDQFFEASCVTRADERLELRLANPREGGAVKGSISSFFGPRVLWGAMARVLDVERALVARPDYLGATGRVRLAIADDLIPENRPVGGRVRRRPRLGRRRRRRAPRRLGRRRDVHSAVPRLRDGVRGPRSRAPRGRRHGGRAARPRLRRTAAVADGSLLRSGGIDRRGRGRSAVSTASSAVSSPASPDRTAPD
jgi:predicted acetyltransferase